MGNLIRFYRRANRAIKSNEPNGHPKSPQVTPCMLLVFHFYTLAANPADQCCSTSNILLLLNIFCCRCRAFARRIAYEMQTQNIPTILCSSNQVSPYYLGKLALGLLPTHLGIPTTNDQPWIPAAPVGFERCAGRSMHILALPQPCTLHHTPSERRQGPGIGLVIYLQQFSPGRSGQLRYPSPPMSDTQFPIRHPAPQLKEEGQQYPPTASEPQRGDGIPQPADPRLPILAQGIQHQRQQHYPGDAKTRASVHYQQNLVVENSISGGVQIHQNYNFGYPGRRGSVRTLLRSQGPGPQVQPTGLTAPPLRPNNLARRTKAHISSACVNCNLAAMSRDRVVGALCLENR